MSILTDVLLEKNLIKKEDLQEALERQKGAKKPLHEVLIDMEFISEQTMASIASKTYNLKVVNLDDECIDKSALSLVSYAMAKRYGILPLRKEDGQLLVATSDPQDIIALDDVRAIVNEKVVPVLCKKSDIARHIEKNYHIDDALYDLMKNIVDETKVVLDREGKDDFGDVEEWEEVHAPIVRLSKLILSDAVKERASDIHIEPHENFAGVRYRIDGHLKNIMKLPYKLYPMLVSHIKVLSELDISEHRKAQDGRIKILIGEQSVDLRISVIPTAHGEKVVLRVLDAREAKIDLSVLGFDKKELAVFNEAIRKPQGMILLTGPTGSGKTSTIYAALNAIKGEEVNIITVEDPVEYMIEGISQIQVNSNRNITFANGLTSILRQDPNVILVGEIRDLETAEIAFRAALTGHLVFSTLHTNSAIASFVRLMDIGLESYVINSALSLVVAQRLVRKICPHCKESYDPADEVKMKIKPLLEKYALRKFWRGKGCEQCGYSGYMGRKAIFEILRIDEKIKEIVSGDSWTEDSIFRQAKPQGFTSLLESGIKKVADEITTVEEVLNVIDVTEREQVLVKNVVDENKRRILIVDDEDDLRKMIKKRVADAGYNTLEACNGKEALECACKEHPDLIIMDIMMPLMDGFEATRLLRSRLETASIPILMLTAKKDKKSELDGFDAGADDYVAKPFDHEKLLARIKRLLQRR